MFRTLARLHVSSMTSMAAALASLALALLQPAPTGAGAPRGSTPDLQDLNGTVVFADGLGGVQNYRIPAIVQTGGEQPALVAFAEARDGGDDTTSRIAVRTSTDGGATWTAVAFAAGALNTSAARAACAKDNFTSCRAGNPAAVWDSSSSEVVLAYVVLGFAAGYHPLGNGVSRSPDGKSWGTPTDVSAAFAGRAGQIAGMPGPGTALQLDSGPKKGRLLVSSHHGAYQYDTVTVSDDGGATWRTINQTFPLMDESALTQLPNTSVLLNMRHKCAAPHQCESSHTHLGRGVAVSNDGGDTFGPISYDPRLLTPICQASIVSFGGATYFSNPASNSGRNHLTIRKSTDNTATWATSLLVEAGSSAGYSCLVKGAIQEGGRASTDGGLLYEAAGGAIKFARFPLTL